MLNLGDCHKTKLCKLACSCCLSILTAQLRLSHLVSNEAGNNMTGC